MITSLPTYKLNIINRRTVKFSLERINLAAKTIWKSDQTFLRIKISHKDVVNQEILRPYDQSIPTKIMIINDGRKRFQNVTVQTKVGFRIAYKFRQAWCYAFWYIFVTNLFFAQNICIWQLSQLPDVFISEFRDTIEGIWIIADPAARDLSSDLSNPYQGHKLYEYDSSWKIFMDPFYPCIKYKMPADPQLDGTDYFIVAESMRAPIWKYSPTFIDCSLSFTCENDQKAFYKLLKDCLKFRIQSWVQFKRR